MVTLPCRLQYVLLLPYKTGVTTVSLGVSLMRRSGWWHLKYGCNALYVVSHLDFYSTVFFVCWLMNTVTVFNNGDFIYLSIYFIQYDGITLTSSKNWLLISRAWKYKPEPSRTEQARHPYYFTLAKTDMTIAILKAIYDIPFWWSNIVTFQEHWNTQNKGESKLDFTCISLNWAASIASMASPRSDVCNISVTISVAALFFTKCATFEIFLKVSINVVGVAFSNAAAARDPNSTPNCEIGGNQWFAELNSKYDFFQYSCPLTN